MYTNYLIIGASGKTGSRVVQRLKVMGITPLEASRSGSVYFDWEDQRTWQDALSGVEAVYLTYYPDLAIPKAPNDIQQFCEIAVNAGVKHVTLLSGRGEPAAQVCELIVQESGLSWTIVRASWFNQNFSEGLFREFIVNRKIALPVDEVKEPFVDVDDIADVVVASLTQAGHAEKLYEVTGPELLSFSNIAQRFSIVLDDIVGFERISMDKFQEDLQKAGVDPGAIEMLGYLFNEVLDGRNAYCSEGVLQALDRPARNFNQFIFNNKHLF